eukprot:GEMP01092444.1.p1 GENE.GEMP01092444.1~~GEMP01092444.1.p1  ORF type:complete len:101 (-),score=15.50 GEMP01092444.1:245-547(-)
MDRGGPKNASASKPTMSPCTFSKNRHSSGSTDNFAWLAALDATCVLLPLVADLAFICLAALGPATCLLEEFDFARAVTRSGGAPSCIAYAFQSGSKCALI